MKQIYAVTSFNTVERNLVLVVRETKQAAKAQIESEINLLKEEANVLEIRRDYNIEGFMSLADNEHNAYCKTDNAEYFWKTACIAIM